MIIMFEGKDIHTLEIEERFQDGDIKNINNAWFMYLEDFDACEKCGNEISSNRWINIDKAVKNIIKKAKGR